MTHVILPRLAPALVLIMIFLQWILCQQQKLNKFVHVLGTTTLLIIAVALVWQTHLNQILTINVGNWPAPFSINLIIDRLSVIVFLSFAIVIWSVSLFNLGEKDKYNNNNWYFVGFWLLVFGVGGAIFAGDLFNLYVWFEVIFISSTILLSITVISNKTALARYLILNLISTFMLLLAIGMIYGITGSLNIQVIGQFWQQHHANYLPIIGLLLFALSVKSGLFPLYFWLPKAYPIPSASTSALISGLVTKTSMIVLLRLLLSWLPLQSSYIRDILLILALSTMVLGVLGAAIQYNFRKILSFHIVSQLGYIALGLAINTKLAIIAAIYFLIHNILVKSNLFLICGYVEKLSGTEQLTKLGDWLSYFPFLSIIFFLSAFSLAGFPPLSGFWGKFLLLKAALEAHFYISAVFAILVSLLTLYSMTKIWNYVFCQQNDNTKNYSDNKFFHSAFQYVAMLTLLLASLWIALVPNSILPYLQQATTQIMQQEQ